MSGLLLFWLLLYSTVVVASSSSPSPPHNDHVIKWWQCNALIQFHDSLSTEPYWTNGTDCCSWDRVTCDNVTGHVTGLDLSGSRLKGALLHNNTLFTLRHLQILDLSDNFLIGPIPASIGNLTALKSLTLRGNEFSGSMEFEIIFSKLKNFQLLDLSMNSMNISVQNHAINCSFPKMKYLTLSGVNLTNFPYFLSSMEKLQYLDLSNNMIDSEIPTWFWNMEMHSLDTLRLSGNKIKGVIRDFPTNWKKLSVIELERNMLEGPVPVPPPSTSFFDASSNNFTGDIPSGICQVSSLDFLNLTHNKLTGFVPTCLPNLTQLTTLLLSDNRLRGPLPRSLANITWLSILDIGRNYINDTFPNFLSANTALSNLILRSNNFHGRIIIPPISSSFPSLTNFIISDNNFGGRWPTGFLLNTSCYVMDLSSNNFEGLIPIPPVSAIFYSISNNKFTGEIPSSICDDTTVLETIILSGNRLSGHIPPCFVTQPKLLILNLRGNRLHGPVPEICSKYNQAVRTIDLSQNQLVGTLPRSMGLYCKSLEVLDLSNNMIEGTFPRWLETLPNLKVLVLKSNRFHGGLTSSSFTELAHPFPQLRVFDISNNYFNGSLPTRYLAEFEAMMMKDDHTIGGNIRFDFVNDAFTKYSYQDSITPVIKGMSIELVKILNAFTVIDLSGNSFHGEIPEVICNLKGLIGLNFSRNNLTGTIPSSVGNLTNLEWLDLSSNRLQGEIPTKMVDMTFLVILNLSQNQLAGQIPQGNQFSTFNNVSFEGNPGLCGVPLTKQCGDDGRHPSPPSTSQDKVEDESWIEELKMVVLMGFGCGVVFGISGAYLVMETGRPLWLVKMIEWKGMRLMDRLINRNAPRNRARRTQDRPRRP